MLEIIIVFGMVLTVIGFLMLLDKLIVQNNDMPVYKILGVGILLSGWSYISCAEFDRSKISVETAHKICNCLVVEVDNQIYNVHEQIKTDVNEGDPIRITVKEGWSYGIYHERLVKLETIPE